MTLYAPFGTSVVSAAKIFTLPCKQMYIPESAKKYTPAVLQTYFL